MGFLENIDRKKLQHILLIVIAALTAIALVLLLIIIISSLSSGLSDGFSEDQLTSYKITEKDYTTGSLVLADDNHKYEVDESLLGLVGCKEYRNTQLIQGGMTQAEIDDKKDPDLYSKLKYLPFRSMKLASPAMIQAHKMLNDVIAQVQDETVQGSITIDRAYGNEDNYMNIETHTNEFNTGLLMYLTETDSDVDNLIPLPEAYEKWLDEHAADYGFIKSFRYGYRYVGIPHAKHMKAEELTLAQYIEFLKTKTTPGKVLKIAVDDAEYAVYYVECKVGGNIPVPKQTANSDGTANNTYEISGTNEGGVIVTVKIK